MAAGPFAEEVTLPVLLTTLAAILAISQPVGAATEGMPHAGSATPKTVQEERVVAQPEQDRPHTPLSPWAEMARQDIDAMRNILRADHPGPVDPLNPSFNEWLENGYHDAVARLPEVRSYFDYQRALRAYANGFRDGHIGVGFELSPDSMDWPGFVVIWTGGAARVASAEHWSGVEQGWVLTGCDGLDVSGLLARHTDAYFWNRDVPHARWKSVTRLFFQADPGHEHRPRGCVFADAGKEETTVDLTWKAVEIRALFEKVAAAQGRSDRPELIQRENLWIVRLPTFGYYGEGTKPMLDLLEQLSRAAPRLRSSTVVLDVRGNGGGSSAWGDRVAEILWGKSAVSSVKQSFDWTVDWRVSAGNLEHVRSLVQMNIEQGGDGGELSKVAEQMEVALSRGDTLLTVAAPPASTSQAPESLVTGRIYLLTDGACASACLDFADLVRRLPGALHIGEPTYADAVYMENRVRSLPSGLARFGHATKVYRNRVRGHNEWYEPQVRWDGGLLDDETLARWTRALSREDSSAGPGSAWNSEPVPEGAR